MDINSNSITYRAVYIAANKPPDPINSPPRCACRSHPVSAKMSMRGVAPLDFPEVDCLIDEIPPPPRTRSLENIHASTVLPPKRPHRHSCQIHSFNSSRRKSTSSNRRASVGSRRHRTSSAASHMKWMSPEQKAREKKRRRTVCVVVGMFLFILFSCVLVVIVTLTHQTEIGRKNNTLFYYTFAPPPDVVAKPTTSRTSVGERRIWNTSLVRSILGFMAIFFLIRRKYSQWGSGFEGPWQSNVTPESNWFATRRQQVHHLLSKLKFT
jgi:hypothetical protein